jgi:hypothetical protein
VNFVTVGTTRFDELVRIADQLAPVGTQPLGQQYVDVPPGVGSQ